MGMMRTMTMRTTTMMTTMRMMRRRKRKRKMRRAVLLVLVPKKRRVVQVIQAKTTVMTMTRGKKITKLGWGHFSTVWMVKDKRVVSRRGHSAHSDAIHYYALKVQKSAEHYTEAAMDEVELLDCIAKEKNRCDTLAKSTPTTSRDKDNIPLRDAVDHSRHVAILHDSFFHTGPNGRHMCMVFSMLGCNLLSVIKAYNYRGIPIPVVKGMVKGIVKGLDFLHRKCEIIHTDLKPENVLLQYPSQMESHDQEIIEQHSNPATEMQEAMSIEEMEEQLKDPKTSTMERKKIRKRLKKK